MRQSLIAAGIDWQGRDEGSGNSNRDGSAAESLATPWRDVWSAGHGVGAITDIPTVEVLVARLETDFRAALYRPRG
jgi:nitronate monooxygenase